MLVWAIWQKVGIKTSPAMGGREKAYCVEFLGRVFKKAQLISEQGPGSCDENLPVAKFCLTRHSKWQQAFVILHWTSLVHSAFLNSDTVVWPVQDPTNDKSSLFQEDIQESVRQWKAYHPAVAATEGGCIQTCKQNQWWQTTRLTAALCSSSLLS